MILFRNSNKTKWIIITIIVIFIIATVIGVIIYEKKFPKWKISNFKNKYGEITEIQPYDNNIKRYRWLC